MYKSAAAFSFPKGQKVPKKNFLTSSHGKPDPGQYQNELLHKTNTGYHFIKDAKLKPAKTIKPGVGDYNIQSTEPSGPRYSAYNHVKVTTFGEMVKKKTRQNTPGPGKYENKVETVKPRTILGKFSKKTKDINYDNKKPGVGAYNPTTSKEFGKGTKNKFSMPISKRSNIVDTSKNSSSFKHKDDIKALAPGYYTLKQDFGTSGIKMKLRGKPPDMKRAQTPGPDKYKHEDAKIKTLKAAPAYGIGKGKKTTVIRKDNKDYPAPGQYTLKHEFDVSDKKSIKAMTFPKSERMKVRRPKTPGPGQYQIPYSFGYTAPYSGIQNKFV